MDSQRPTASKMFSESSISDDKSYNKLTPVIETMHAITWDGNNATIMGTLLKIQEWITRTGQFRLVISETDPPPPVVKKR